MNDPMNQEYGEKERLREIALHRFMRAFDTGDLEELGMLFQQAGEDPELERMLEEASAALYADAGLSRIEDDARLVRSIMLRHFPQAVLPPDELPAPTVGDVAARIQADPVVNRSLLPPDRQVNGELLKNGSPLPSQPTTSSIAELAKSLPVSASARYWELFRREAVALQMAHGESEALLLAARSPRRGRARRRGTGVEGA